MRTRSRIETALTAAGLLVTLAGCGSGDGANAGSAPTGDSGSGSGSTTPAAVATNVRSAELVTENFGWSLTAEDLVATSDDGATWVSVLPTGVRPGDIAAVEFVDATTGWVFAVGVNGYQTYGTVDGGHSWTQKGLISPPRTIVAVFPSFVSTAEGWVEMKIGTGSAYSEGLLYGTSDGGDSWAALDSPGGGPIRFVDPKDGWMADGPAGDELSVTRDGGVSWSEVHLPAASSAAVPTVRRVSLPGQAAPGQFVLPIAERFDGESVVDVYVSDDAGSSWKLENSTPSITAAYTDNGVEVVGGSVVYAVHSDSSGITKITPEANAAVGPLPNGLTIVDGTFVDGAHGWVIGAAGSCSDKENCVETASLLSTEDGGMTWTLLSATA